MIEPPSEYPQLQTMLALIAPDCRRCSLIAHDWASHQVLARDQKAYRTAIVQGGGLAILIPIACTSPPGPTLHHAVS